MNLSLPRSLRPRLVLLMLGLPSFAFLQLHAALALGLALVYLGQAGGLAWGLIMAGAAVLCVFLVSLGTQASLMGRRFLLEFCRWNEAAGEPEGPGERRNLLRAAREAFEDGLYAKAAERLGRYLESRPADSAARLNLAWTFAAAGEFGPAREQLKIAGDPLRQDPLLDPARTQYFRWRRAFKAGETSASATSWEPPLAAAAGLVLALCLSALDAAVLLNSAERFLKVPTARHFLLELAKGYGNFKESEFKSAVSGDFILHYHDEAFMREVQDKAQDALAYNLRFYVLPQDQFASQKIKIYLCDSQEEFLRRSPLHKSWEAGVTLDDLREIYLYRLPLNQKYYFENTLAHEISHVCYRQVLPGIGQESWLNEGLASYLGYLFMLERLHFPASDWLKKRVFADVVKNRLPFEDFLKGNPQGYEDVGKIAQFYDQGFSIAYVLIHFYGKDSFIQFLHHYSRQKDLVQGLRLAYPTIQSLSDLQGAWLLFMKN